MKSLEFDKKIKELQQLHPIWFKLLDSRPATIDEFRELEKKMNVKLPFEYEHIVTTYGGGYFAFSILYSVLDESDYNIYSINEENKILAKGYILFSENQVGDFYGFKIKDNIVQSKIYFYDHEIAIWKETKYHNLYDFLYENMKH